MVFDKRTPSHEKINNNSISTPDVDGVQQCYLHGGLQRDPAKEQLRQDGARWPDLPNNLPRKKVDISEGRTREIPRHNRGDYKMKIIYPLIGVILLLVGFIGVSNYKISSHSAEGAVVVLPSGEEISIKDEEIVPSTVHTDYVGQSKSYHKKIEMNRTFSLAGDGAVTGMMHEQPSTIGVSTAPGINIGESGITTGPTTEGAVKGGGFSWTWWDSVKEWLHNASLWVWIAIGGAIVVFLVLPALVPAAAPIVGSLATGIKNIFLWMIPIVGGAWSYFKQKAETLLHIDANDQVSVALQNVIKTYQTTPTMTGQQAIDILENELSRSMDAETKDIYQDLMKLMGK
jgi:hypothetical protein